MIGTEQYCITPISINHDVYRFIFSHRLFVRSSRSKTAMAGDQTAEDQPQVVESRQGVAGAPWGPRSLRMKEHRAVFIWRFPTMVILSSKI